MERTCKSIPIKSRQIQIINYSKNIQSLNDSNNNISQYYSLDIEKNNIRQNNSYFSLDEKRIRINPRKFGMKRKNELRKPELKKFHLDNNIFDKIKNTIDNNKSTIVLPRRKTSILHLSANFEENKNNSIISPKMHIPKKIKIKNNFFSIKNNLKNNIFNIKKEGSLNSSLSFLDLGKNVLEQNKYFSDIIMNKQKEMNERDKKMEKKDWESVANGKKYDIKEKEETNMENKDIKIELLAKDLNLFQNYEHFKNINLKKNNSYNNLLNSLNLSEENITLIQGINKNSNLNENISLNSRISTRTPSSRIYSGKIINNFNNINVNRFNFDKNKIRDLLKKREANFSSLPEEYEYNIEGTNLLSPFCEKARDLFLYNKIFFYFGRKKLPKIMNKFLNNKLNLCYAENEKQFEEKIARENILKMEKGKGKILKVGKADTEKRAESINHKIGFIKKVFDYAYPDILIYRIKKKSNMDKKEIRKINLKKFFDKQNSNTRYNRILMKREELLNSIKIAKVD